MRCISAWELKIRVPRWHKIRHLDRKKHRLTLPGPAVALCYFQWATISRSAACCGGGQTEEQLDTATATSSTSSQSVHQPLYPPGRIIHIVRHHPSHSRRGGEVAYQGQISYQSLSARDRVDCLQGSGLTTRTSTQCWSLSGCCRTTCRTMSWMLCVRWS